MKKLLSIMLTAAMICSLFPRIIGAEETDMNLLVDGAIETADTIPDGGWKPIVGSWTSGLGTSVTIDTDVVSTDSTKSVKITNAAIQQKVALDQGIEYSVSLDIYLKQGVDVSKLEFGLFAMNGEWAGTQANGYQLDTTLVDTDAEDQWQTVSYSFTCSTSAYYTFEIIYSGGEYIYADNLSLVSLGAAQTPTPSATTEPSENTSEPTESASPDIDTSEILTDPGFESATLSSENEWKFPDSDIWYSCSNAAVNTENVYEGEYSVLINGGAVGQRITLEAGKRYKLSASVYPTEFYANGVKLGFYDGTTDYPMSNAVKEIEIPIDWTNEWVTCSVIMDCETAMEYVVGCFVKSSDIYFDSFSLTETDEEEIITNASVSVDYNTQSEITYDKNKILNLSRGGYLINNNINYMPSFYDKMSEDGVNMVRMDWMLADVFYETVSRNEDGELVYDFTNLDKTLLPLLEKGMKPFLCMSRLPVAIGGDDIFGEVRGGVQNYDEYSEVISAIVKHYVDMGYTGWYWESHNEPEDQHMGDVYAVCKEYGAFATAVKGVDPTAQVGGIGYRNSSVEKETSWKSIFFAYLRDSPDIPLDFVSIHEYNGVVNFEAGNNYKDFMAEYGLEEVPIIFSEWNYDWTTASVGSFKDTNCNGAYAAKRMFSAIAQDTVDYVFYFTPSDALCPNDLMYGDSGIYTIDGHRKSVSNVFAMYNDLESECLQTEEQFLLNRDNPTYGVITKNSDTARVSMLLFNYKDEDKSLDVEIENLPYNGNVKITTKIMDEDSGNYYKDYAAGLRGYGVTPHELPDTYTEVREAFTSYTETIDMTPYSVIEIVFEPSDEDVSNKTKDKTATPVINLAAEKPVTASSEDTTTVNNAKEQPLLWGASMLTDSHRLSFDMVNRGDTNMGYRSEAFDSADNNVWVEIDLEEVCKIDTVRMYPLNDEVYSGMGMPVDFTIQVSSGGSEWTEVYTEAGFKNNGSIEPKTVAFDECEARYVRINATKLSMSTDGYRLQLLETEVYGSGSLGIINPEKIKCTQSAYFTNNGTVFTVNTADTETPELIYWNTTSGEWSGIGVLEFNLPALDVSMIESVELTYDVHNGSSRSGGRTYSMYAADIVIDENTTADDIKEISLDSSIYEGASVAQGETRTETVTNKSVVDYVKSKISAEDITTVQFAFSNSSQALDIDPTTAIIKITLYDGVILKTSDGEIADRLHSEESIYAEALYSSDYVIGQNLNLYLAIYNTNGTLKELKQASAAVGTESEWDLKTDIITLPDGTENLYAKIFLWGDNMEPMCDAQTIEGCTKILNGETSDAIYDVEVQELIITDEHRTIYGKLYSPVGVEKGPAVILSHGFGGNHSDYDTTCRYYASYGYASYTFDFCGGSDRAQSYSDTTTDTTEMTIFTERDDLLTVFDYISTMKQIDSDYIYLSGGSQGGLITVMAAEERADEIRGLLLQFPALNIPDNWRSTYPDVDSIPEVTDLWGVKLGREFFVSMHDYYPYEEINKFQKGVLIIQGDADTIVPVSHAYKTADLYENSELIVLSGEGHGFSTAGSIAAREYCVEFMQEN